MERDVLQGKVSKKKLNTVFLIEPEMVGASDYIPWIMWGKRFCV